MNKLYRPIHFILNSIASSSCLVLASHNHGLLAVIFSSIIILLQIYWQYFVAKNLRGLFSLLIIFTVVGMIVDSFLVRQGLIIFNANLFASNFTAPWMINVWLSFAVLFYSVLSFLLDKYILFVILSFFGFTVAYFFGVKIGAAVFPFGYQTSFLIGAIFALMLPAAGYFYKNINK